MKRRVLIIDDDQLVCTSLKKALTRLDFETQVCLDGDHVFESIEDFEPDLILLDIYLTTHDGIKILREIKFKYNEIPVIMITGYADVDIAVKTMKIGAADFLLKPLDLDQLKHIILKATANLDLKKEVEILHSILKENKITPDFFGQSRKIKRMVKLAEKLAKSSDTTILIQGESGTGKEVFAKFIHQHSPRANEIFIQINCATIPKDLAESELFGHEKGAFTGAAQKTKLGKFELAHGGTILLDEIGELTLDLQVKLLRVLQEKKFFRVGGEKEIEVDVRVLAATNKNLENEVEEKSFREDLFYRLNVANIEVPPLRDRKEDVPALAFYFVSEFNSKFNKNVIEIEQDALQGLINHWWKGNIRELRNTIERAMLHIDNETILKESDFSFMDHTKAVKEEADVKFLLQIPAKGVKIDTVVKELILKTLKITEGNQVKAAKVLGLSRSKLRYRMEQLGISLNKKFE